MLIRFFFPLLAELPTKKFTAVSYQLAASSITVCLSVMPIAFTLHHLKRTNILEKWLVWVFFSLSHTVINNPSKLINNSF